MNIIKRSGEEQPFDVSKITAAITKANNTVEDKDKLSQQQIDDIGSHITDACEKLARSLTVEEIQDLVETQIMRSGAFEDAKNYITYRYKRSLLRQANTTDNRIISLIECSSEEAKEENANKNPTINSVQRDYMAGEVSKDITRRFLLDPDICKAHDEGIIHFHDADYFAQHMHNCDLVNLEDMLQNGTVITGTIAPRRSRSSPQRHHPLPRSGLLCPAHAQLLLNQLGRHVAKWHGYFRHHDRKAAQFFYRLQYRYPNYRSSS